MKKTIFMAIVGFAMLATSCSTGTKVVQFTELKNYFYRNDAPKGDQLLKLTTQEDFNRYFGEALIWEQMVSLLK
jgi:lipoprotein